MASQTKLTRQEIGEALETLSVLSQKEYRLSLKELLEDPDKELSSQRLKRRAGVLLKSKFGKPAKIASSQTGAKRAWKWNQDTSKWPTSPELDLLEKLRQPGPWNDIFDPETGATINRTAPWPMFMDEVDHERGLFKIVALYVADVFEKQQRKTLAEYYRATESPRLRRGLDLASIIFDSAVTAPILGITGIPGLSVSLVLLGIEYGFEKITEPDDLPDVNS